MARHTQKLFCTVVLLCVWLGPACLGATPEVIPHAQDRPPGPPLSPAEAVAKMTVPEGFSVELVAAEPDIVNPVAMTFDERGRIWITESLEYPRLEAGPGRDRIKVLEDTDGDGRADKFTIFAEGLNIPSGIAVGYGGVWIANAPDILFLVDTDGDGRADQREIVVTGFGRDDTHELPNSLTWGPDGWLYGLNGVFNRSHVVQGTRQFDFTCALFRIHPRTREFQIFCEGTSNPWGIAWDSEGSAFVSACVIDHLWHLTESAYYIRQGGPYPPFTAPAGSIVKHKHQKAAYCGIHYFDSDAYPAEYRERLYMGNIHGAAINVDVLTARGSSYESAEGPDFLSAHDAWFMPVVQKTGPDGSLYILDWYDRYHCYQDARRDSDGIDRLKGRLYRVRYQNTPRVDKFDLAHESDDQLIARLHSPNVLFRDLAQRILSERANPATLKKLSQVVLDDSQSRKGRLHALWALVSIAPLAPDVHQSLLTHVDPTFRAWAVRAGGNQRQVDSAIRDKVRDLATDPAGPVRLQVAIAARKIEGFDAMELLLDVLAASPDDALISHVVWQNLHPLLETESQRFLALSELPRFKAALAPLVPRAIDRVLGCRDPRAIAGLIAHVDHHSSGDPTILDKCLRELTAKLERREFSTSQLGVLKPQLAALVSRILDGSPSGPLFADAALLGASWQDERALKVVRGYLASSEQATGRRARALDALVAASDISTQPTVRALFDDARSPVELRSAALESLAHLDAAWVADLVLGHYAKLEPELRPMAIELLTEREQWAEKLLEAVENGTVPSSALNINQVRQLLRSGNPGIAAKVKAHWGSLRADRNPDREKTIGEMRALLRGAQGDAVRGREVFRRVCGQCHKIYGEGQDVGPDITLNGRNSFELLLSNVFDPSLVIGPAYQARTVATMDGRVLSGLLAEESPARVVLKTQGGKLEIIPRDEVEEMTVSRLSLMPEELEKQLKPEELVDLFAFLTLDKPPEDAGARRLPGAQVPAARESKKPADFDGIVAEVAPGFSLRKAGGPTVAIVAEHAGRMGVLSIGPLSASESMALVRTADIPADKRSRLVLSVSARAGTAWLLSVRAGGQALHESLVECASGQSPQWRTLSFDLNAHAGHQVKLEITARARSGAAALLCDGVEVLSE